MTELFIPFPPSANRLWTRTRKGMRKTDTYAEWLKVAGYMAIAQKPGGITGPYHLSIQARRPDKRRRDIDNLIKPISDLLQSVGVIEDDTYCEMVSARWVTSGEPCRVKVEAVVTE
jgi:crossover junction endodeoxyribonuclease RusA